MIKKGLLIASVFIILASVVIAESDEIIQIRQIYSKEKSFFDNLFAIFPTKSTYIQGEPIVINNYQDINEPCSDLIAYVRLYNPQNAQVAYDSKNVGNVGPMTVYWQVSIASASLTAGAYKVEFKWYCSNTQLNYETNTINIVSSTGCNTGEVKCPDGVCRTSCPLTCTKTCGCGYSLVNENSADCYCVPAWVSNDGVCSLCEPSVTDDCLPKECTTGQTKCEGEISYDCISQTWVDVGHVNGRCGYTAPTTCVGTGGSCELLPCSSGTTSLGQLDCGLLQACCKPTCTPNCVGKCGGVSDGCSGTCDATCGTGDGTGINTCVGNEESFYTNGYSDEHHWFQPDTAGLITSDMATDIDSVISGFSSKYRENKVTACCSNLTYIFVQTTTKEYVDSIWDLGLDRDSYKIDYDIYKCVTEDVANQWGNFICIEQANQFMSALTNSENCGTNTIVLLFSLIILIVILVRMLS